MRADHRWLFAGLLFTGLVAWSLAWAQEPSTTEDDSEAPPKEVAVQEEDENEEDDGPAEKEIVLVEPEEDAPSQTLPTFDEVWQTVNDSYFDADFGGLDWQAVREKYRPKAADAADAEALRGILNDMLRELGESHFGVMPGSGELEEMALLGATSSDDEDRSSDESEEEGSRAAAEEPSSNEKEEENTTPSGDYSGIHLRVQDQAVFVSAIDEGSPGEKVGLRGGYELLRIGKLDVAKFMQKIVEEADRSFSKNFFILQVLGGVLENPIDGEHQKIVARSPRGKEQTFRFRPIRYPGQRSQPVANMPSVPLRVVEKRLALPLGDVLYLHFNIFLPQVMPQLREAIASAVEDKLIGVIIDLRGNPGGIGMMANGIAGLMTEEQFSLGHMKMRAGDINFVAFPQDAPYLGPLVVLIDGMSASTSEIFAAGLQESGRAKIIGRRSMGAALPSYIRILPNGDRLQHAIADLTTASGRRIEGRGVIPDLPVKLNPGKRFRGVDPDLERARRWLQRESAKRHAAAQREKDDANS